MRVYDPATKTHFGFSDRCRTAMACQLIDKNQLNRIILLYLDSCLELPHIPEVRQPPEWFDRLSALERKINDIP